MGFGSYLVLLQYLPEGLHLRVRKAAESLHVVAAPESVALVLNQPPLDLQGRRRAGATLRQPSNGLFEVICPNLSASGFPMCKYV